jgi:hypothetical protein
MLADTPKSIIQSVSVVDPRGSLGDSRDGSRLISLKTARQTLPGQALAHLTTPYHATSRHHTRWTRLNSYCIVCSAPAPPTSYPVQSMTHLVVLRMRASSSHSSCGAACDAAAPHAATCHANPLGVPSACGQCSAATRTASLGKEKQGSMHSLSTLTTCCIESASCCKRVGLCFKGVKGCLNGLQRLAQLPV